MRISRAILGLCLIGIAITAVPVWLDNPVAVVISIVCTFLGLGAMGGISGIFSKSVGQMFLERASKKALSISTHAPSTDLQHLAEEEFKRNADFQNECLKLETELREIAEKKISQEMSEGENPRRVQ